MLYAGIILHGICYDFFFVTGYMYTEKKAGEKIKNAAQGLFTFATYGVGMFIGTKYSGYVVDQNKITDAVSGAVQHNWTTIWLIPAAIAGAVLIAFILFFNEKKETSVAN
jgi:MFS family permease